MMATDLALPRRWAHVTVANRRDRDEHEPHRAGDVDKRLTPNYKPHQMTRWVAIACQALHIEVCGARGVAANAP